MLKDLVDLQATAIRMLLDMLFVGHCSVLLCLLLSRVCLTEHLTVSCVGHTNK